MCEHKLGVVQDDGYQYCQLCGLAIAAECIHHFDEFASHTVSDDDGTEIATDYVRCCLHCGLLKTYRVGVDKSGYV